MDEGVAVAADDVKKVEIDEQGYPSGFRELYVALHEILQINLFHTAAHEDLKMHQRVLECHLALIDASASFPVLQQASCKGEHAA